MSMQGSRRSCRTSAGKAKHQARLGKILAMIRGSEKVNIHRGEMIQGSERNELHGSEMIHGSELVPGASWR
jgi:hypothetical protein